MWRSTLSWQDALRRAKIIESIRKFFSNLNIIEIETPCLSNNTVTDVHLDAFASKYDFLSKSNASISDTLYLQTSPEFAMKRLLASGFGSIYQICKAFRHEEAGSMHNPEFTILEWYRLDFDHHELMGELEDLLKLILGVITCEKVSYQNVFLKMLNIDPLSVNFNEIYNVIEKHGKGEEWLLQSKDKDLLLQFAFTELIEPKIGKVVPIFVYDFPIAQASLARTSVSDPRVAHRFECYFKGIELANGFNELTDAELQYERFNHDNEKRQDLKLNKREIDKNFIDALNNGLPYCSGVALGIDRLIMLALEKDSIEQVIAFPIERA